MALRRPSIPRQQRWMHSRCFGSSLILRRLSQDRHQAWILHVACRSRTNWLLQVCLRTRLCSAMQTRHTRRSCSRACKVRNPAVNIAAARALLSAARRRRTAMPRSAACSFITALRRAAACRRPKPPRRTACRRRAAVARTAPRAALKRPAAACFRKMRLLPTATWQSRTLGSLLSHYENIWASALPQAASTSSESSSCLTLSTSRISTQTP